MYELPVPSVYITQAVAPVVTEIFTKFVPIATAITLGFMAVRKLSGSK